MAESAYFTRLHIENVRCFGDQTLDLTADGGKRPASWTLILGDNGVGKTTLLQCLAWMRPWKVKKIRRGAQGPVPALFEEENAFLKRLQPANRTADLSLRATLAVQPFTVHGQAKTRVKSVTTELSIDFGPDRDLTNPRHSTTASADIDCFVVAYGVNRQQGVENLDNPELEEPVGTRLADVTELYDAEKMLKELDYAFSRDSSKKGDVTRFKQVLARILPDDVDPDAFQIFPPDPFNRGGRSGVYLDTFSGLVGWTDLSLGYRTTLAWTADLAWRLMRKYPNSANPLSEPVVVLIDEIDLHLHPRWQRGIVGDLSAIFEGAQFVATTHSPLMAQVAAEDANFVLLRKRPSNGDVEIINDPVIVKEWRVDQFLTSDLFGALSARSPDIESKLARRDELIRKRSGAKSQDIELAKLRAEISQLPTAESPEDQRAMESIREAAALLRKDAARSE